MLFAIREHRVNEDGKHIRSINYISEGISCQRSLLLILLFYLRFEQKNVHGI